MPDALAVGKVKLTLGVQLLVFYLDLSQAYFCFGIPTVSLFYQINYLHIYVHY